MIIILLGALFFFILFLIYPYVIYPSILSHMKSVPIARNEGHRLSVSLVFCAYNEEAQIPEKIKNIVKLRERYPDLEVLAYDDNSSDETLALLQERPDLLRVIAGSGRTGKAHGMKLLAREANGEIIVFTDANVLLEEQAINNLMAYFADPEVGGVCGSLQYVGESASATAAVGSAYWRLEERIKSEESRTGSVMGGDGSIFSLRRALYPTFPDSVLDDMTVSMSAVFAGKRLIKAGDVIAYERLVASRRDEVARKVRIATRAFHTHLFLRPQLRRMTAKNKFKYVSHKFLRWFGGGFFLLGLFCFILVVFLASTWLALVALLFVTSVAALGWTSKKGKLASLIDTIIALLATQWGVVLAMLGHTRTTWTPAASR